MGCYIKKQSYAIFRSGDLDDRKSTSGYLFKLSVGALSYKKNPQAEYTALASAAQETI